MRGCYDIVTSSTHSRTGVFNFVQDILGNHLAGVPPKRVPKDAPLYEKLAAQLKVDAKAFKMFLYGFFISAPLSHYTTGYLQKAFAGKTNTLAGKLAQILASCLISSPITAVCESRMMLSSRHALLMDPRSLPRVYRGNQRR